MAPFTGLSLTNRAAHATSINVQFVHPIVIGGYAQLYLQYFCFKPLKIWSLIFLPGFELANHKKGEPKGLSILITNK